MERTFTRHQAGFTLVELIVAISILGLLVALTLPSIQQSRAASRKVQCQNHQKQLGIAMHLHCDTHGVFPSRGGSMLEMLPGLGQAVLRQKIIDRRESVPGADQVIEMTVPEFVCPSDYLHQVGEGNSNYYWNEGTKLHDNDPTNGFDQVSLDTRPSSITDGMSQTAAISERLVGVLGQSVATMERDLKRYFWFTPTRYEKRGEELLAVQECRERRTTVFPQFYNSQMVGYSSIGRYYNHLLLPNEPACYNGPEDFRMTSLFHLAPPSSLHEGGVNVLLADGSVRFVSENIDETIWRSIGTISEGEAIVGDF